MIDERKFGDKIFLRWDNSDQTPPDPPVEDDKLFVDPSMSAEEINQIIADAPEYTTILFTEGIYEYEEPIQIIGKNLLTFIGVGYGNIIDGRYKHFGNLVGNYTDVTVKTYFRLDEQCSHITFQNLKVEYSIIYDDYYSSDDSWKQNRNLFFRECVFKGVINCHSSGVSFDNCLFLQKASFNGDNIDIKNSETRDLNFYTHTAGYYSLDNVRIVGALQLYGDETDSGKPYINNSHISHFFNAYETPNLTIKGTFFNDKSFLSSQKNLQISDCIFQSNSQDFYLEGLEGTDMNIVDCYFRSKSSSFYGENMVIDNCIFEGNISAYPANTIIKNSEFKDIVYIISCSDSCFVNNNFKTLSVGGSSPNVSVINNNISEKLNVTQGATDCFVLGNKITSAGTALNIATSNCKVSDNFISGDADSVVTMSYTSNSLITNNKISGGGLETSGISKCVIQGNDVNTIIDNSGSSHEVPADGNYYLGNRVDSITLLADDGYTNHSKIGDNFITSEM